MASVEKRGNYAILKCFLDFYPESSRGHLEVVKSRPESSSQPESISVNKLLDFSLGTVVSETGRGFFPF